MMELPPGVGPHEGRELELMLAGKKKLALFGDVIPASGIIAEDIIPEKAFASYVQNEQILRFVQEISWRGDNIRHVAFTLPQERWRAKAAFWLRQFHDDEADIILGRLLGYTEDEISAFLSHFHRAKIKANT